MADRIEDGGPAWSGVAAGFHVLPYGSGDGYGYGGGAVLTVGDRAFLIGEGNDATKIAKELARLWNEARARQIGLSVGRAEHGVAHASQECPS
jgi:hypothetical protein